MVGSRGSKGSGTSTGRGEEGTGEGQAGVPIGAAARAQAAETRGQEKDRLVSQQEQWEAQEAKAAARAQAAERRGQEKDRLVSQQEQELLELVTNAGSLAAPELAKRKAELQQAHKKQLSDFDKRTSALLAEAEKDVLPSLQIDHAHARLELREKQLKELADAMKNLSPEQAALIEEYAQDAEKAAEAARDFRETKMKELNQEMERIKEEKRRKEEDRKKKLREQVSALEQEIEEERKRDEKREKERLAEREKRAKAQLEEREKQKRKEVEQMNVTEDEKERILAEYRSLTQAMGTAQGPARPMLKARLDALMSLGCFSKLLREHEENMLKLNEAMQKDQERSKAALKAKLEARREKKRQAQLAMIEEEGKKEEYEEERRANEQLNRISVEGMGRGAAQQDQCGRYGEGGSSTASVWKVGGGGQLNRISVEGAKEFERTNNQMLRPSTPNALDQEGQGSAPAIPAGPLVAPGDLKLPFAAGSPQEQDFMELLVRSPLFQHITEIEDMLKNTLPGGNVIGAKTDRPYLDIKDAQWLCSGDLMAVDINDLTPSHFVVYRFGVFITQLLSRHLGSPEVTLLLASNLPPNDYERNAFRHSFLFQHAKKILFIRKERMESVGEFVVVLLHCLAHIKVNDLADDNNPYFLREFYKAIKLCCQDMFFARSRSSNTSSALIGGRPANGRTALEAAFRHSTTSERRGHVVSELINTKVTAPVEAEFSSQHVSERMANYQDFTGNSQLRGALTNQNRSGPATDVIAAKLRQLRGKKELQEPQDRPSKPAAAPAALRSHRDLLRSQVNDLQGKLDTMTAELTQVVKSEQELSTGIDRAMSGAAPPSHLERSQQQLATLQLRRENIAKRIAHIEAEVAKKQEAMIAK
ncbi:Hypp4442 [Branchiostoma lanceolatum]|uniref:Hypp4442 protein n=1 Tax=Branchiostoma lanceolatum TaxID=7740 RepID=A0A8K0F162_BRALA|nr:Hypp4442 [Branchiostoma lanceolatum]